MKSPSGEAPNHVRHVRVGRRGRRARSGEQFASWETTYGREYGRLPRGAVGPTQRNHRPPRGRVLQGARLGTP